MGSPSSAEIRRPSLLPSIVGGLLGSFALLASHAGVGVFFVFVCIVTIAAALDLCRVLKAEEVGVSRILVSLGALALPAAAYWKGEARLGLTAAFVVIGVASVHIARGLRPDSLRTLSATVFGAVYTGLLAAFAILMRTHLAGDLMVLTFAFDFGGYLLGSWTAKSILRGRMAGSAVGLRPSWREAVLGCAGAVLGSLLSLAFMPSPYVASTAVILALIVTAAAILGELSGKMLRADLGVGDLAASVPGMGGIVFRLDGLIFAVPAFYYGFRLFLS